MNRNLLILAGVALLLVGLVLALQNPFQDPLGRDEQHRRELGEGWDLGAVDEIEVSGAASAPVVLRRGGSGWVVASRADFPADTAAVGSVLRSVSAMEAGPAVSRNPSGHAALEVDAASGVEVTLRSAGHETARFTVGKAAAGDFTSSYVRLGDADEVYAVRGVNRNLFQRGTGYRDRGLLAFAPESVDALVFAASDSGWTVTRGDTAWSFTGADGSSGVAQGEVVDSVLRDLSALVADGFAQGEGFESGAVDSARAGLLDPEFRITVRLAGGGEETLSVGKANERSQRYVIRADRPAVYLLGEWRLASLRRGSRELPAER